MRSYQDVAYVNGGHPLQKLDLYLPDGTDFPTFLFFHGGGLEKGDKSTSSVVGEYLAAHGIGFVSANYRMYPDARYPDFIQDAACAVSWVKRLIGTYGGSHEIYIGGSSAGAYLSMMLCFDGSYLRAHGLTPCDFAGFLHAAGQPTKHFRVLKECGTDSKRVIVDETAPLYHVGLADRYPPMRFLVSDADMTNRYEQTVLMLSTLRHFGHGEKDADLLVLPGKHTAYVKARDAEGVSVFGPMIEAFIKQVRQG